MKKSFLSLSIVVVSLTLCAPVYADDTAVIGNGSESSNTVNTTQSSNTTVSQSNSTTVSTTVNTNSNTGNNASNGNNGDTAVSTGDTSTNTQINTQTNSSTVNGTCNCQPTPTQTAIIKGNGAGSSNEVNASQQKQTTVTVGNKASITNVVVTHSDTGNNSASSNTGDTSIHTGNVGVSEHIFNDPSIVSVTFPTNANSGDAVKVAGNGAESQNITHVNQLNTLVVTVSNISTIYNTTDLNGNTGNNEANANVGNVHIITGSIFNNVDIANEVNKNIFAEACCQPNVPGQGGGQVPPGSIPPSSTSAGGNGGSSSGGSGGSGGGGGSSSGGSGIGGAVLGSSTGNSLPVTGYNWMWLALFANVVMLFMGAYIRLRSGRAPSVK